MYFGYKVSLVVLSLYVEFVGDVLLCWIGERSYWLGFFLFFVVLVLCVMLNLIILSFCLVWLMVLIVYCFGLIGFFLCFGSCGLMFEFVRVEVFCCLFLVWFWFGRLMLDLCCCYLKEYDYLLLFGLMLDCCFFWWLLLGKDLWCFF